MKKGKILISLIFYLTYAITIWYLLKINYFFNLVSLGAYDSILSDKKQSIMLMGIGIVHVIAILLFLLSNGKRKKMLVLSGVLGSLYVLIHLVYRLIESISIGLFYFSYESIFGHLGCLIFAIMTILISNNRFDFRKLE